ncbi:MAG TPA: hypothetical protein VF178_14805 [Gemmatimonadaceae bacterium]
MSSEHEPLAPAASAPPSSAGEDPNEIVDFFARESATPVLRHFLREHILWLFGAGGLAAAAFVVPSSPWYLGLARILLFALALFIGGPRVMQINGIIEEFHRRHGANETNS